MFKINFQIDKHHLAYKYVLRYFNDPQASPEWAELKRCLAEKYEAYPGFLFFEPENIGQGMLWFNLNSTTNTVIRDKDTVNKIFESIFKSEIFKKVYLETEAYKNKLEEIWRENNSYLKEYKNIIRLKKSIEVTVLVLHPSLGVGSYINDNTIEWGSPDFYKNYQFIGLCHELLHVLTEEQFLETGTEDEKWLLHSLIYLSTDEELRLKLNGGTEYFIPSIVETYHPHLIEIAKKLLPVWKKYINEQENIIELYERLKMDISKYGGK